MIKYVIVLSILFSTSAIGQELATVEATKKRCAVGAMLFSQTKIKESFNLLKEHWPLPEKEINSLIYNTKIQLGKVSTRFGKMLSSDYIKSETAGDSFTRHIFVIKFEKHAIRYLCTFYKPKDSWIVNSVTWDDSIDLLF